MFQTNLRIRWIPISVGYGYPLDTKIGTRYNSVADITLHVTTTNAVSQLQTPTITIQMLTAHSILSICLLVADFGS